jgi:cytochrome b6-f complex iron-sulfur subunit
MAAMLAFLESCKKDEDNDANFTLDLTDSANAALNNVGGFVHSSGVMVMHTGSSSFAAVAEKCTHQGCTVNYSSNQVACPCHGSRFGTDGSVTTGPATKPLRRYTVTQNGNILTVKS